MNSERIVASLSANPVIKYAYSDVKLVSGYNYSATCKYCQYGNTKVRFFKIILGKFKAPFGNQAYILFKILVWGDRIRFRC